ncbi:MAG: tRNA preQ1(34) S-adenosylmethionine ribosyltransferase-isomerase QueA [Acidobacteriota bacterium]|nr:tRNA preQ1(34) S-adenosylmethionine ribosyltransferase-isomerase QueA [Acidobacteriota bacterium]MDE3264496.1 tRNA preQ1(34) S-adenosylmethionine ribosyltransferase-isomerase QueA [Acidobacteriota bacterium]
MTGPTLRTSDFDYHLPPEAIAQHPGERGESRLLVLGRTIGERRFAELPDLLDPGDLLVVNDTRVIPARLRARRPTGGRVEILLVEREGPASWWCLLRPGRRLPPGAPLAIEGGPAARVDERVDERFRLTFAQPIEPLLQEIGETPLPPYIDRPVEPRDRECYQTIYAVQPGAVAAPTAGLHFTPALLDVLERHGVRRASVTLHVGPGTFRPVKAENPELHVMDSERFEIPEATAEAIAATRRSGRQVVAVGTTVVRTLETASSADGLVAAGAGRTGLYIRPGYEFRVVDRLITNFHLPRSTLLMLVCAFAGRRRTLDAYRQAIRSGFRFTSYGDAMLLDRMR